MRINSGNPDALRGRDSDRRSRVGKEKAARQCLQPEASGKGRRWNSACVPPLGSRPNIRLSQAALPVLTSTKLKAYCWETQAQTFDAKLNSSERCSRGEARERPWETTNMDRRNLPKNRLSPAPPGLTVYQRVIAVSCESNEQPALTWCAQLKNNW